MQMAGALHDADDHARMLDGARRVHQLGADGPHFAPVGMRQHALPAIRSRAARHRRS